MKKRFWKAFLVIECCIMFVGCGKTEKITNADYKTVIDFSELTPSLPEKESLVEDLVSSEPKQDEDIRIAKYIGIKDSLSLSKEEVLMPGAEVYIFEEDGAEYVLAVDGKDDYAIQNMLIPGYRYKITVEDNTVSSVSSVNDSHAFSIDYKPPVSGIPGKRTVLNLLKTAFEPLGTTLYIYGGGWNFQDDGSSNQARTIGVSDSWIHFFNAKDATYKYHDTSGNGTDYFPENSWNTYFYHGLDCSGFLGWTIYNTMYDQSLVHDGFVFPSAEMARILAEEFHFGKWQHIGIDSFSKENYEKVVRNFCPGDIVSIKGHVYMVVGVCQDNSVVIIHSSVTPSSTGDQGGGVQLSAVSVKGVDDIHCEAYKLACYYTAMYPEWEKRYPVVMKDPFTYFVFPENKETTGIFHWDLNENGLSDPEGIVLMNAAQVLQVIFS